MIQQLDREKSFMERLGGGLAHAASAGTGAYLEHLTEKKHQDALKKQGLDVEGLRPEYQAEAYKNKLLSEREKQAQNATAKNKEEEITAKAQKESLEKKDKEKKERLKKKQNKKILDDWEKEWGLAPGELNPYIDNPTLAKERKPAKETPKKESTTEKVIRTELAKTYIEAKKDLPKLYDALSNLDQLTQIGEGALSGVSGSLKSLFNTESAARYANIANLALEPIFKVFNPSGNLATRKMEFLRDQFVPTPGELRTTQKGKEDALKLFANQAIKRAQSKIKLFEDYNNEPPESVVTAFDNESEQKMLKVADNIEVLNKMQKETPEGRVLMIDPDGKPLHVDVNAKAPNGKTLIEYYSENGAHIVDENFLSHLAQGLQ